MPDIEFLDESGGAMPAGEPPTAFRRPRLSTRRIGLLALALVLALVVAGVVATHRHRDRPTAAPSPRRSSLPEPHVAPVRAEPLHYTPVGSLLFGNVFDASDSQLLATADRLYALGPDELGESDLHGLHTVVEHLPTLDESGDRRYRLVDDPANHRLWVVPIGGDFPGLLRGFSDIDLGAAGVLPLPGPLVGAAYLDGALYLATRFRIYTVGASGRVRSVRISGQFGPLVADPARHRLLSLPSGVGVVSWTPRRRRLAATVEPHGPTVDGSAVNALFVVGGRLWGAADEAGGTVYVPLDPRTFDPDLSRAVSAPFGADVVVASTSRFLLRASSTGLVSCVDAATGHVLTRWAGLPGPLAAFDRQVLSIAPNGLVAVPSDGCF